MPDMDLKIRLLIVILILAACDLTARPEPPLPPLLVNVTAGGGWWGACPPKTKTEEDMIRSWKGQLALSPELNERLTKEFPPGTDESQLIGLLTKQGFEMQPSCSNDQSIHRASFTQHGGSGFAYRMLADIFWKVDERNAIVWTKGFVMNNGL